ncbi:ATP-binding protein [Novosphingobium sp. 11B]
MLLIMLPHPMLDQIQTVGLTGIASAYRELAEQAGSDGLAHDEWLGLMLDREIAMRSEKRLANWLAVARP